MPFELPSGWRWGTAVFSTTYVECALFGEMICKLGRRFSRGVGGEPGEVNPTQAELGSGTRLAQTGAIRHR